MTSKNITLKQDFDLELGGKFSELNITYQTYGTLNKNKSNVIWVCHALTANANVHEWWKGLFGENNFFDPSKYFIVCANNLGSPYGTTSAKHINPITKKRYGLNFPETTLRDTAKVHLLLFKQLQLERLHILIGGSCGGNIALEMAFFLKDKIDNLITICNSAKEKPWAIGIHESQRMILDNDVFFFSNQNGVAKNAMKAARALSTIHYRTAKSINAKQQDEDDLKPANIISYLNYQGKNFAERFDSHCYYKLLNCLDTHNVGRNRNGIKNALKQLTFNYLSIGIDSDGFIPNEEQKELAKQVKNSTYKEIKSIYGHDAFLIEYQQLQEILGDFLGRNYHKTKERSLVYS